MNINWKEVAIEFVFKRITSVALNEGGRLTHSNATTSVKKKNGSLNVFVCISFVLHFRVRSLSSIVSCGLI